MNSQFVAIVVGSSADELVVGVVNVLDSLCIKTVRCEDVYSAVVMLREGGNGAVFGRLGELLIEDSRLLDIARKYGYSCCCLLDGTGAKRRREMVSAMERGAFVFSEIEEISRLLTKLMDKKTDSGTDLNEQRSKVGSVIDRLLDTPAAAQPEKNKAQAFRSDEFIMTKAELDALLGAQVDED